MKTLEEAYSETAYQIQLEKEIIILKIGKNNQRFVKYNEDKNIENWMIITAFNPYSKEYSDDENKNRNEELKKDLKKEKLSFFNAKGIPEDINWKPEESFFVWNLTKSQVEKLAVKYEQNAVVYGEKGTIPQLMWF